MHPLGVPLSPVTLRYDPLPPYEPDGRDTEKTSLSCGAEHVLASSQGEVTEFKESSQQGDSDNTLDHFPPQKGAIFIQQEPSSVDKLSHLHTICGRFITLRLSPEAFRNIVPRPISFALSRVVESTSEMMVWTNIKCRINLPFLEPPLGSEKVRVRWTCVSARWTRIFTLLITLISDVGQNCMMISKKPVLAQQKSWQSCLTIRKLLRAAQVPGRVLRASCIPQTHRGGL